MRCNPERRFLERRLSAERDLLDASRNTSITPQQAASLLDEAGESPLPHAMRIAEVAKRPGVSLAALMAAAGRTIEDRDAALTAELELKYSGYFERERIQADRLRKLRDFELPIELPYGEFRSLSTEARQKLARVRPTTLEQAGRIPGVNHSDLQNLVVEVERRRKKPTGSAI